MGSCAPLGSRAEVIDALTEREQAKELKGQRKKRKAEDRALRAAAVRTAAKRSKRKVPKRPWTPEPEGDGEKENVPPAAAPVQTAADPVVPAIVPAVSPALLAAARIAYPSLSLSSPPPPPSTRPLTLPTVCATAVVRLAWMAERYVAHHRNRELRTQ